MLHVTSLNGKHFDLFKLAKNKLTNANILRLVRFRQEQISAIIDSILEQWRPGRTINTK